MLFKSSMLVAISLLAVTLASGVLNKNPGPNQDPTKATEQNLAGSKKEAHLAAKQLDDAATPIVDLLDPDSAPVSTERSLKNGRYDNQGIVQREIDPSTGSVIREPIEAISDIPLHESDLIVEGRVTKSAAFLSNDKSGVYSELTVLVSDILKNTSGLNLRTGDSITAERFGGRVKYPNGQIVRYGIVGQGSPAKGKDYLFFLTQAEQGNYKILTAYELQGKKVQALDGSRVNLGIGDWVFDKHNDEDYQAFREALDNAAKNPPGANQKRRFNP